MYETDKFSNDDAKYIAIVSTQRHNYTSIYARFTIFRIFIYIYIYDIRRSSPCWIVFDISFISHAHTIYCYCVAESNGLCIQVIVVYTFSLFIIISRYFLIDVLFCNVLPRWVFFIIYQTLLIRICI